MNFQELINQISISTKSAWMIEISVIVLLTLAAIFFEKRFYKVFSAKFKKTKTPWDDAIGWSIHKPLQLLIWLLGLYYAAKVGSLHIATLTAFSWIPIVKNIGIIFIVSWAALRFTGRVEKEISRRAIDKTTTHAVGHLARIIIMLVSGLVIMQTLKIDLTAVLAFGGAGSIIIGFASKDLLANFFGALIIYMDKPFKVGDWIRSPDKNIEGTVEYIGWRLTRIRTFDKRPLYVPNAVFSTISVENPSRMTNRRIKEIFGVRYKDANKVQKIVEDVKVMLQSHPDIDCNMALFVNLNEFGASSLDCLVYTFTKTTEWIPFQAIKQDIMHKIIAIVESNGAELAFPTRTLELPDGIPVYNG
jgi:MscS family membrane protein